MTRPLHESRLANLDLNLLVSLNALLEERSVSRAAARLGLSQPSLSAALSRLRRHFHDDLLSRVGNNYELTPLAAQLAEQVTTALAAVGRVFASEPDFDPATAEREFTVLVSDYAITVLGPALATLLQQAPSVRLRLHQVAIPVVNAASQALRDVDAMVLPHGYLSDLPSQQLFTDRWVCIVAADHPGIGEKLTMTDLEELPMVVAHREPALHPGWQAAQHAGRAAPGAACRGNLPGPAVPRRSGQRHGADPGAARPPARPCRPRPHPVLPVRRAAADGGAVVASHVPPRRRAPLAAPAVHRSRATRRPGTD